MAAKKRSLVGPPPSLRPERAGAPESAAADAPSSLHRPVLAVDGTFLHAAAVVWSLRRRGSKTGARLDFQVDAPTWLPELIVVPETGRSEATTASSSVTPGAIPLDDRGIFA